MNVAARVQDRTLVTRSARMACVVRRRGVTVGDCVALMLPCVPELAVVVYGVLRVGGVVAPLSVELDVGEVRSRLQRLGARLLVAWQGCAEVAEAGARGTAEVLFVAPGEFERLLAGAEPDRDVVDRAGGDEAIRLLDAVLTHGDLAVADEPLGALAWAS